MQLLLPYATDSGGKLIHISQARKGDKYTCPKCGAELLLRTSKIPEGEKHHRRPHFAHRGSQDHHCSESVLHRLFKEKCAQFIETKIKAKQTIPIKWLCRKCHEKHSLKLLEDIAHYATEYDLGICKPDIALFNSDGIVVAVVEIVVTHKPEPKVLNYYKEQNIICVQIKANSFDDCEKIGIKLANPSEVSFCPYPICKQCGKAIKSKTVQEVCEICTDCAATNHQAEPQSTIDTEAQSQLVINVDGDPNLIKFLLENGPSVCSKCGGKLHIDKTWAGEHCLKCDNPQCDFVDRISNYDHLIFSSYPTNKNKES